jgi:uncharacterized protein with GYD domain
VAALLLYGTYTPVAWTSIRVDPGVAPAAIEAAAATARARLAGYWFAFDEFDFYAMVEGDDPAALALLRHRLMSGGAFTSLHGEPCFAPDEMIGALNERPEGNV